MNARERLLPGVLTQGYQAFPGREGVTRLIHPNNDGPLRLDVAIQIQGVIADDDCEGFPFSRKFEIGRYFP